MKGTSKGRGTQRRGVCCRAPPALSMYPNLALRI